ncbi:MAG: TetR/AcrR family transcriptional regulator [Pseudomonadota bacterium]
MPKKPAEQRAAVRRQAVTELKRALILDAAGKVFAREGLAGASIREIAKEAGYTPGALYFHYASKEEIYAELLAHSLQRLYDHLHAARDAQAGAAPRLEAAALALFDYYVSNPQELELGFYLFGGMRAAGLTPELDAKLNAQLRAALALVEDAVVECGATPSAAVRETASLFAQVVGLLVLEQTRRIRLFKLEARPLFVAHVAHLLSRVGAGARARPARPPRRSGARR